MRRVKLVMLNYQELVQLIDRSEGEEVSELVSPIFACRFCPTVGMMIGVYVCVTLLVLFSLSTLLSRLLDRFAAKKASDGNERH